MTREELIAELERAEGPSHRLDHETAKLVFGDRLATARYTGSLDAALTLVPEGLSVLWFRTASASAACAVVDGKIGEAVTPAIALCIASLKARA